MYRSLPQRALGAQACCSVTPNARGPRALTAGGLGRGPLRLLGLESQLKAAAPQTPVPGTGMMGATASQDTGWGWASLTPRRQEVTAKGPVSGGEQVGDGELCGDRRDTYKTALPSSLGGAGCATEDVPDGCGTVQPGPHQGPMGGRQGRVPRGGQRARLLTTTRLAQGPRAQGQPGAAPRLPSTSPRRQVRITGLATAW